MLGTSDAWSMSRLSQQATKPAYYIVDCRIYGQDYKCCTSFTANFTPGIWCLLLRQIFDTAQSMILDKWWKVGCHLILASFNFEMVHRVLLHCNVLMQEGTRVACDIDASLAFFLLFLIHNVVK